MDVNSNHLDVVGRGGYGWREEVDDGEEIARRSETFGHPVGKSASFRLSMLNTLNTEFVLKKNYVYSRRSFCTTSLDM